MKSEDRDVQPLWNDETQAIRVDHRFQIGMGKTNYPLFAAGQCAEYYSFIDPHRLYSTSDTKYNIEAGFHAAMQMLDKDVTFSYIPTTRINLPNMEIYYVGE